MERLNFFQLIKPRGTKRLLLFMAAFLWTFAGSMLLVKGIGYLPYMKNLFILKIISSIGGGILFYILMFSKISSKHVKRILSMDIERPCLFSFFNIKSYILMTTMVTFGISLRKFNLLPMEYLPVLYITMGIPLALSSVRFYYHGIWYKSGNNSK